MLSDMSEERAPTPRALRTRQRLLDAARDVFARKGYEQATVADVAARADRGHGTFYLHFRNKKAVFAALLESVIEQMTQEARELWRAENFLQSIESTVARFLEDFRKDRDIWALLDQMAAVDEEFALLREGWRDLFTANVRRGLEFALAPAMPRDEIHHRAQFLAGLLDEAGRTLYIEGRVRDPRVLTSQITTLWLVAMGLDPHGAPVSHAGGNDGNSAAAAHRAD